MTEPEKQEQIQKLVDARSCLVEAKGVLCQTIINLEEIRRIRELLIRSTSLVTSVEHRLSGWPDPNPSEKPTNSG